jgi:betaine-homocysteine S-methyltransferase
MTARAGLGERLAAGAVLCAEGYLFALEARGYLSAGPWVPEAVLDHPDVVEQLHRDFVRCGSDVVVALTFYAHRDKLRALGREGDVEPLNRQALALAKRVAVQTGTLAAGNICNTRRNYEPTAATRKELRDEFDEQLGWAVDAGVDFIIGETFYYLHEAEIALDAIKATGLPGEINFAIPASGRTEDNIDPVTAAKCLEARGADVIGLNCFRGPWTMWPVVANIRRAVSCHVAALPVPYRTTDAEPTFFSLTDDGCACASPTGRPFPLGLDPFRCTRYEMATFSKRCVDHDIRFVGVCCGGEPYHILAIAEALGRRPAASRYTPDMSKQPRRKGW